MKTAHQTMHLPGQLRRQLLKNKAAYVESVGKPDMSTLADVMTAPDAKGTVLRLILGATTLLPLRALTYVDSALRCAGIIPFEQLQIIHANNLGGQINKIDQVLANESTHILGKVLRKHVQTKFPSLEDRVLHAVDTPMDLRPFQPLAQAAFASGQGFATVLAEKGAKHGGDAIKYASAHFAFQDTNLLDLRATTPAMPDQIHAERIVSIGCQQERNFYLARMAMRALAVETDLESQMVPTAQVFTHHLTPPYFTALGGEPALHNTAIEDLRIETIGDPCAARDLANFMQLNIEGGIHHA